MDKNKIIYWIATGLLCALMLFSAGMYFFNYEMVAGMFENFGYPTYIIYPLAIAKVLGVIAIVSNASKFLKEWAYAGFFFDMVLAVGAHLGIQDGGQWMAVFGLIMLIISRYFEPKVFRS